MRPLPALLLAAIVSSGCRTLPGTPPPAAAPPAPKLVVLLVIDQLPAWGFEARRGAYRHGLDRLLREGVYVKRARYPYAILYTASGHAAIGTGAAPRETGIVGNSWYRRAEGRDRPAERDPASAVLGLDGQPLAGVEGASGAALRVDGLAEALRAGTGGRGRSVVIAGKARAACFVAGRRPDVVLWYEPAARALTTSAAYGSVPAWAVALAEAQPAARFFRRAWGLPDPEGTARATGGPDDGPGEGSDGRRPTFPHRLDDGGIDPAKGLRFTPFLDVVQVDAAIAAIEGERLGADEVPDLLAISLSAHDYAGHAWGQESWEMLELERRLDRELVRLWDALDAAVGPDRYAVVLTSDHGATPMPDRHGGLRIAPRAIEATAEAAAAGVLGEGDWIAAVSSGMIYGAPALDGAAQRAEALAAIAAAVDAMPGVARVVKMDRDRCEGLTDEAAVVCGSTVAGESGDLFVWPEDGGLVTSYTAGTSHDPPSLENREIPILVRAPGLAPRVIDAPTSALGVTATVAKLLGVAPPPAAAPALPIDAP